MRALLKFGLFLTLLFALPIAAQAQTTEDDFFTLLEDVRTAIHNDDDLTAVRARLAAIETIMLPDGHRVPIDTTYWIERLDDADTSHILAEIDATLSSRQLPITQPQPNGREVLQDVLNRSDIETEYTLSLSQRVWRWLNRWIQQLANQTSGRFAGSVVIIIAIIVTGLVVFFATRRLRGELSAESHLPTLPDDDPNLTAHAAFDNAQTSADSGDYRTAVRYLYLSALLSLDERDLLRFDRSKTNREYLRSVAGSQFAPTLRSVIDVFDRVWYGFRPIDPTTFAHYRQQVSDLLKSK